MIENTKDDLKRRFIELRQISGEILLRQMFHNSQKDQKELDHLQRELLRLKDDIYSENKSFEQRPDQAKL